MTELQRQLLATNAPGESARARQLALLEAYYYNRAYDGLPRSWDQAIDESGSPIPFRARRPSTVIPLPRLVVDCFVRGLWGASRRPTATLAGQSGTEDNELLFDVIREAGVFRAMREATRRALSIGSGVLVWRVREGRFSTEAWDAKYATPTFKPGAFPELERLDYQFTYTKEVDGKPTPFVHRELIDDQRWIVYSDVEATAKEPTWREDQVLSIDHGLGFVPAVWFVVGERCESGIDGEGLYASILGLLDDLNYTASQQGRSVFYNLDPQTVLTGVPDADLDTLLKGGKNTWALPPEGDAKLLESNGSYVTQAQARIDMLTKSILDACAVVKHDPERISGGQSGSALELLLEPQLARIDELREDIGGGAFVPLLQQMLFALSSLSGNIELRKRAVTMKAATWRHVPIALTWGAHLPATPTDALTAASAAEKAIASGVLSRAAAQRYLAPLFGVADVEADADEIRKDGASQIDRSADRAA